MAIFHLSVKTISRSAGRTATAAAAYRSGAKITDERTGEIHDYTRKGGVESAELVLPADAPEWARDRAALWNAAEQAEKRKNSTVAREFEIALPSELSPDERQRLARDFARELVDRHGCAADVAIHTPGKEGDNRNHHAHILLTTRRLTRDGLGEKTRELDDKATGGLIVTQWRERFATLQNERLQEAGHAVQVDHLSLKAQGIDREPTQHLGPAATGYERRTGEPSRLRLDFAAEVAERLARARELERQSRQTDRSILVLSGDIEAAKRERAELLARQEQERQQAAQKPAIDPRSRYHPDKIAAREAAERAAEQAAAQQASEKQVWLAKMRAAVDAAKPTPTPRKAQEAPQQAAKPAPVPMPAPAPVRAPQTRPDPAMAERQRIERMSAAELAEEIRRLRPLPVPGLVEHDQAVKRAEAARTELQRQHTEAQSAAAKAKREAQEWREAHPVRAKAHDAGLMRSPYLDERQEQEQQARQEWQRVAPRLEGAALQVRSARDAASQRITTEQAPARQRVVELEKVHQDKARQEQEQQRRQQAEKAAQREREAVPKDFRDMAISREHRAYGWGDSGSKWQATPEKLKKLIEGYNAAPKEARAVILDRLVHQGGAQMRELIDEQRSAYRAQDRGRER